METGAEKIVNWIKKFVKVNGTYPTFDEIDAQLATILEEERTRKTHKVIDTIADEPVFFGTRDECDEWKQKSHIWGYKVVKLSKDENY